MASLVLQFVGLSAVVVTAATFLSRFADQISERSGWGGSLTGLVLLAGATSLPELAVTCHAATIPAPDLAVGDLLGSCLVNLLVLGLFDLLTRSRGRILSHAAAAHGLSAAAAIHLVALVLLFLVADVPWPFERFGPGSLAIGLAYALTLRLIYFDQIYAIQQERPELVGDAQVVRLPWRKPAIGFGLAAAVIFITAPFLAHTADELAHVSGLGETFVGTALLALATTLPESSTTFSAIRLGNYDMAIGNIFGSISFNMLILVAVDAFYAGPLLSSVSATHAITAAAVIITMAAATMGMLYRAEKRLWVIEPDAALVVLMVLAAMALVYHARR